jgi:hypothetical protein
MHFNKKIDTKRLIKHGSPTKQMGGEGKFSMTRQGKDDLLIQVTA